MHHFSSRTAITFRSIQGLATLLYQQKAALDDLVALLIEDVGVFGLLTHDATANFDPADYVINGHFAAHLSSVQEFVNDLASWANSIGDEVNQGQRIDLWNDILHDPVELSAAQFIRSVRQFVHCLEHRYSVDQIDVIGDEHKLLLQAYWLEPVLKNVIDALSNRPSFKDGWNVVGCRFTNLMEFCGVLATLFSATGTVESDVSV